MKHRHIAILGTGSDVGKSIIGAGICRWLSDQGQHIAPFKAQNMSNNSGITPEGLEMGRAQIVQAEAARVPPHVEMNPILLKPTGEKRSQVILNGRVHGDHTAMAYHRNKSFYFKAACEAFDSLAGRFDRIVLEGAGSCAEVNLMPNDIVNFAMAEYAEAEVILTADIHRGGVFAQIVGTLDCLPRRYRDMIKGFIINRFRGDISLFKEGVDWIQEKTGKKVLGVLPWYTHFRIDAEDSVEIETIPRTTELDVKHHAIAVIRLPHIANFTDIHALSRIKGIQVCFVEKPEELHRFNAVILPGSKNTRDDLNWLNTQFDSALNSYVANGGHILGICGGYQMLGSCVKDPEGLEGLPGTTKGIGLLPVETILKSPKTTTLSEFYWEGVPGQGYEIHMGHTMRISGKPFLKISSRNGISAENEDGCVSMDGKVAGTYVHGFFDSGPIAAKWLASVGVEKTALPENLSDMAQEKDKAYDLLKRHMESHLDLQSIL